jgi:hypothetical protein
LSAVNEFVDRLVGQWVRPLLSTGGPDKSAGPWEIKRAWSEKSVIMVAADTPDGERVFKAHECFITKTKDPS